MEKIVEQEKEITRLKARVNELESLLNWLDKSTNLGVQLCQLCQDALKKIELGERDEK